MVPHQDLCHECYHHLRAAAVAPSRSPVPAVLMPQSNLPAISIEARAKQKTPLIHFDILVFYQCSLASFMSIWLYFTPDNSTSPQSRLPDVQYLLLQPYHLWQVKSNRNLPGEPGPLFPTVLHALLWAPLSKQVDHICDTSGSYFGDELVVPPSIGAWDAKLWSEHLKDQQGGCCTRDSRRELGMWGSWELQR